MSFEFQPIAPPPKRNSSQGILIGVLSAVLVILIAVGAWVVYTLTASDNALETPKDGNYQTGTASAPADEDESAHKQPSAQETTESKDAANEDAKRQNAESKDTERKEAERKNTERKEIERKDSARVVEPDKKPETSYILVDTPSQNISCQIYNDRIGCSIANRSYSQLGLSDCPDKLYSITVNDKGVQNACGSEFLGRVGDKVQRMEYGSSMKSPNGRYQCNLEESGMACRNLDTGHGFKIAREEQRKF